MLVLEYKVKAKERQYQAIDEAIRTSQFVRNKALRLWMDAGKEDSKNKYDLNKYCRVLAANFDFARKLNSTARQASAERAWAAISRFYENCKKNVSGKKGYPKFKKNSRSVEYKKSGWKLDSSTKKHIEFTDKNNIGRVKLVGSRDIYFYSPDQIQRVRLVRRADGYYCQFCVSVDLKISTQPTGNAVGLDVGLKYFLADSNGKTEPNPRFYRRAERQLNRANRKKSRKYDPQKQKNKKRQSHSYHRARVRYARKHLRVSRQRKEYCKRVAYSVIQSNDLVAYEDLNVRGLVKNRKLSKSIADVGWSLFRSWLEYFGHKYGKTTVAVPPHYTSQDCSECGARIKKSLSTRTHVCSCGCVMDRDANAAINILQRGLSTAGHVGIYAIGDLPSWAVGENLRSNGESLNVEPLDS